MFLLILSIPIITVVILASMFRKKCTMSEYALVVIPSLLLFAIIRVCIIECVIADTEYLGDVVKSVTYYEDWDETVRVSHTRKVPCGTDDEGNTKYRTETYYTYERRYHPEEWQFESYYGSHRRAISRNEFNLITAKLCAKPIFKDMHRDYRSKDGDAWIYYWDKTEKHAYTLTFEHTYRNKVKAAANSIFNYSDIQEDKKNYKLYEYPDISNHDQCTVLGVPATVADIQKVKYLNATRGPRNQFRLIILGFQNVGPEAAEIQKAYWQGGNKNEFVVCLGLQGNKVVWCNPFSWCDKPTLEVKTKDYFITNPILNISAYTEYLASRIDIDWDRKKFEDFNYLDIPLSTGQYMIIMMLIIFYNIGISIWIVTNEFDEDHPNDKRTQYGGWYHWRT